MTRDEKCSLCPKVGKIFYKAQFTEFDKAKEIGLCGTCMNQITTPLLTQNGETSVISPTILKEIIEKDKGLQSAIQKEIHKRYDVESENLKLQKDAMTPKKIKERLAESIIGQDEAIKTISLAINRSYLAKTDPQIEKTNILFAGPTGTGKTQLARVASQILNSPMIIVDCSSLTSSGYVGDSVDSIFVRLYQKAKGDIGLAQNGIVVLDEFDKIVRTAENGAESVVAVQNELLQVIADGEYYFTLSKNSPAIRISTKNILFIACGAFSKIREEKAKKTRAKINLSVSSKAEETKVAHHQRVTLEDIKNFGIKSELIGRFTHFCDLNPLGVDDLVSILTDKKGCMDEEYRKIFNQNGNSYLPSKEFYRSVAQEAVNLGLGARGLRQVMESRLKDYIFNGEDFIVNESSDSEKECLR